MQNLELGILQSKQLQKNLMRQLCQTMTDAEMNPIKYLTIKKGSNCGYKELKVDHHSFYVIKLVQLFILATSETKETKDISTETVAMFGSETSLRNTLKESDRLLEYEMMDEYLKGSTIEDFQKNLEKEFQKHNITLLEVPSSVWKELLGNSTE